MSAERRQSDPEMHSRCALRDGLKALGWIEGRNCQSNTAGPAATAGANPDSSSGIGACGSGGRRSRTHFERAVAAKETTNSIPIVFVNIADPVGSGLIASLARTNANVTGLYCIRVRDRRKVARGA